MVASTQRYWSRGRVSRNINSFNHHSFLDTGCLTKHDSWWIVLLPKFVKFNWYQRILHGSHITVKFIYFLTSRYLFTYRGYYSLQDCYYGFNTKLFCDVIVYIQYNYKLIRLKSRILQIHFFRFFKSGLLVNLYSSIDKAAVQEKKMHYIW